MGRVFLLWSALAVLRNTAVLRYLIESPEAWDRSCLTSLLADAAGPALVTALILALIASAGRTIARRLAVPGDGALALLPGALGLGLFGAIIFVAGLTGRLGFGIGAGLALAVIFGFPRTRTFLKSAPGWLPTEKLPAWKTALAALLAFSFFHVLINALAPPVGWDALAYHLAIPRLYLDADAVRPLPWLLHGHWPHLMEMIYAAPLALGQESCAALVHAAVCAALVLAVYLTGREEGGPAAGWSAAALLAAQPVFLEVAAEPHSDGALALFHLMACLALWRWSKHGGRGLLAAAGLCSGLAAACKLPGLALSAFLVGWLLVDSRRRAGAIWFVLWAALPAAPWYLKTWAAAGNPVWPFYPVLFGGLWEPERVVEGLMRTSLWRFPRDSALLWRYGPQFLLLPAAGLAALAAGRGRDFPPVIRFLFFVTAPLAALSVRYHEAWRYLFPLAPILALACGWWCARACRQPGARRGLAVLFLGFGLWPAVALAQSNELFAVLSLRSRAMPGLPAREVYRARQLPFLSFYRKAADLIPSGERVLLFREVRGYHLRADYQWGDPVIQTQIVYDRLDSPQALRRELERHGLTFVLVNEANGLYGLNPDYYGARTLALMNGMLALYGREALREGGLALYELKPLAPRRSGSGPAKAGTGRSGETARQTNRRA